jgi:hypothetical protein
VERGDHSIPRTPQSIDSVGTFPGRANAACTSGIGSIFGCHPAMRRLLDKARLMSLTSKLIQPPNVFDVSRPYAVLMRLALVMAVLRGLGAGSRSDSGARVRVGVHLRGRAPTLPPLRGSAGAARRTLHLGRHRDQSGAARPSGDPADGQRATPRGRARCASARSACSCPRTC